jgi:dGTPase
MLSQLWETLETRYIKGELIDGQDFQLLPHDTVAEIEQTSEQTDRARLICDYLAGMTDGYATRTFKRLFSPDFGSINDL